MTTTTAATALEADYNELDDELAGEVLGLLESLPAEQWRELLRHMSGAVAHYDRTGHVGPLIHFARSVRITMQLQSNKDYLRAVEVADAAPLGDLESAEDVIARARERRAR